MHDDTVIRWKTLNPNVLLPRTQINLETAISLSSQVYCNLPSIIVQLANNHFHSSRLGFQVLDKDARYQHQPAVHYLQVLHTLENAWQHQTIYY